MERSRRLVAAPKGERGGERADPVITYTRLTDDASGRVEPRFSASVSRHAAVEDIELLPQVEAPPSQAALDIDEIAEPVANGGRTSRRRTPRTVILAGFLALIGGAGVLAATYGGMISLDTRSAAVPVPVSTVVHAGGVADAPAALPAEAGRNVRVIAGAGSPIPDADGAAAVAIMAPGNTSDTPMVETAGPVIVDPPQPRLRPATASYNPPQTGDSGALAAPTVTAAADPAATVQATTTVPATPGGSDVDSALASVDRILEERALATGPVATGVPTEALPYPVLPPLPNASDPYAAGAVYPAYPAPNAYPQTAYPPANAYPVYGPPPPPGMDLAADDTSGSLLPRRRVFLVPNAPVPPADIPNAPSSVWGN